MKPGDNNENCGKDLVTLYQPQRQYSHMYKLGDSIT